MNSQADSPSCRREFFAVVVILALFVVVNLAVATRTPTVNCDEPGYCDPAANLYLGNGFTSNMWGQDPKSFWCGNVPLYQGILFCFFKVLGFGFFQARLVNTVLVAVAGLLIWLGLKQASIIQQSKNRLLALALILSGSVSTVTFRTIRYDATMFFVCAMVFFACSFPGKRPWKFLLIVLCSSLLLPAGIPMLPYVCLLLFLYAAVYGFSEWKSIVSIAAGMALGLAGLLIFYHAFGSVHAFIQIILPFTAAGTEGTSHLAAKIFGTPENPDSLLTCFFGKPTEFLDQKVLFDYSAALLFIVLIAAAMKAWKTMGAADRKLIVFLVSITLVVPPVMHMAGHYRSMYRWMTYIPLAMALPRLFEISALKNPIYVRRMAYALVSISLLLGIPARTLAIVPRWNERSPGPLQQVVAQIAKPADAVVGSFKTYFVLKPRVKIFYAYGLPARGDLSTTPAVPTNEFTLLCVFPDDFQAATNIIGGQWKKLSLDNVEGAAALAKTRYAVDFYRRAE